MTDHMKRAERRNRGAFLLVALGIGLVVFALVDDGSRNDAVIDTGVGRSSTSAPTVLGMVITRGDGTPQADPAAAAPFEVPTSTSSSGRPTHAVGGTTTPPPTIG